MLTQIFTGITTKDTHTQTPQPIPSKCGCKTSKTGCTAQPVCITYWELLFHRGGTAQEKLLYGIAMATRDGASRHDAIR